MSLTPTPLLLGQDARQFLLEVLRRDVAFLSSHGFMDYSLLVAVEPLRPGILTPFSPRQLSHRFLGHGWWPLSVGDHDR